MDITLVGPRRCQESKRTKRKVRTKTKQGTDLNTGVKADETKSRKGEVQDRGLVCNGEKTKQNRDLNTRVKTDETKTKQDTKLKTTSAAAKSKAGRTLGQKVAPIEKLASGLRTACRALPCQRKK